METRLIPDEHREHIKNELNEKLEKPVRIVMFTQEMECQFCTATRQLIDELAGLSDKIKVEIYDFVANAEKVKEYGIDKVPALAIVSDRDYGIRFYGLPYGYEFQTLMDSLMIVSSGKTDLSEEARNKLREINTPVHIQIFVTLTCPYCALAAGTAYKFSMENNNIRVDIVEASEFPQLAVKYAVMGVPKTVINDKVEFVGLVPENMFLEHVLLAAK